jgi:hypothetical protein
MFQGQHYLFLEQKLFQKTYGSTPTLPATPEPKMEKSMFYTLN